MAMWLSRKQLCSQILDCIWPRLAGDEKSAPPGRDHFSAKHAGTLVEIDRILPSRLAQVEERTKTVESKLMAFLTLTSLLSTVVAGSVAAATLGPFKENPKVFVWLALLLVFYAAVQILRSLWATLAGLKRRG